MLMVVSSWAGGCLLFSVEPHGIVHPGQMAGFAAVEPVAATASTSTTLGSLG
jgi:hypothetical protein